MEKVKLSRVEKSWSLYDVGVSAFSMLLTAIIPVFVQGVGKNLGYSPNETVAHWGFVQSAATLFVAFIAPILGAMADHKGKKRLFFNFFLTMSIISLLAMALFENYYMLLLINLFAGIGYSGSNIIYDAFLVDVTDDDRMDYVSSFGFAVGYIGSCVPFILSIALIMAGDRIGLSGVLPVKISFALNAVWWLLFSIPFLKNVKQVHGVEKGAKNIVADAIVKVLGSIKTILKNKTVFLFLLAYFFYIDGVDTIIKMSTIYGDSVGIDTTNMIIALLATQIVAFPSVLLFAKVAKRFSAKRVILFAVAIYIGICVFGYFLKHAWQFWVLAITVGLVQGTIQALSRSFYGRLIPDKNRSNEYFGFYNILGRYATVLGPVLMGAFSLVTGNTNSGVLSIALLFIAGFVILLFVPDRASDDGVK